MGKLTDKLTPAIRAVPPGTKFTTPHVLVATWFGAGLLRPAPGTMGSLAAIPFGYAIMAYAGPSALAIAAFLLLLIGTVSAGFYGKKSGVSDDQSIVVDEVAGLWIAAIPAGTHFSLWMFALLLFRVFDIWKPWPASYFDDRSRGGFDVMMDDVVAGIYALFGVAIAAAIKFT